MVLRETGVRQAVDSAADALELASLVQLEQKLGRPPSFTHVIRPKHSLASRQMQDLFRVVHWVSLKFTLLIFK